MATRKMNFKLLRHHINEVCKLIDASDAGMAAAVDKTLDLDGPETEVRSPDDEHRTGNAQDSRGGRALSMREAFGLSMNGPLHQHQPKKP